MPLSQRDLVLRARRQLTLPPEVCEALHIDTGDRLTWSLTEDGLVVRPRKQAGLAALRAVQEAFAASGISEEEMQQAAEEIRAQISRERYGER
jgi:antitoxin component of MazEF toxin-antitoxin module